nr:hypothetical protein [Rhizoctonia sp.]
MLNLINPGTVMFTSIFIINSYIFLSSFYDSTATTIGSQLIGEELYGFSDPIEDHYFQNSHIFYIHESVLESTDPLFLKELQSYNYSLAYEDLHDVWTLAEERIKLLENMDIVKRRISRYDGVIFGPKYLQFISQIPSSLDTCLRTNLPGLGPAEIKYIIGDASNYITVEEFPLQIRELAGIIRRIVIGYALERNISTLEMLSDYDSFYIQYPPDGDIVRIVVKTISGRYLFYMINII